MQLLHMSQDFTTLIQTLGEIFKQRKWFCATAESCTGGLLGAALTSCSGSSTWFAGGIMAYANAVKLEQLNVSEKILLNDGAVSEACVLAMSKGLCHKLKVDVGISISGIAGPLGGSLEKPVGTVWIGYCIQDNLTATHLQLSGSREEIRTQAVFMAIDNLLKMIA